MIPAVNDNIATLALADYNRPVGVSILPSGQNWKDRQTIQYAALKGLMKNDFHGLADFEEQMKLYSSTNQMILNPAFRVVQPLMRMNRNVLQGLVTNPTLGMAVGRELLAVVGFDQTFSLPTSILEDNASLKDKLS